MSKELEAFNKLMEESPEVHIKSYNLVYTALQRLESIDNANPNEALECLEKIIRDFNETTTGMNGLGEIVVGNELLYFHKKELDTIEQALLKAQEQEISGVVDGRTFGKEFLYLRQSFEQCNDKPIFYVSRTYGNKYIIPQKQFDDLTNENAKYKRVLKIIKEKCVSVWHLMKSKTVEEYNSYLYVDDIEDTKIFILNQEEFDLLKECLR